MHKHNNNNDKQKNNSSRTRRTFMQNCRLQVKEVRFYRIYEYVCGQTADKYNEEINIKTSELWPKNPTPSSSSSTTFCTCTCASIQFHSPSSALAIPTDERSFQLVLFLLFYCNMDIKAECYCCCVIVVVAEYVVVIRTDKIRKIYFQFVFEMFSFLSSNRLNINYSHIYIALRANIILIVLSVFYSTLALFFILIVKLRKIRMDECWAFCVHFSVKSVDFIEQYTMEKSSFSWCIFHFKKWAGPMSLREMCI